MTIFAKLAEYIFNEMKSGIECIALAISAIVLMSGSEIYGQSRTDSLYRVQTGSVIPFPAETEQGKGTFPVPAQGIPYCIISGSPDESSELSGYISGLGTFLYPADRKGDALLTIRFGTGDSEGYTLSVKPRRIDIEAGSYSGALYAVQTLMQMAREGKEPELACCTVNDSPRFRYRGLHFDVSRHFRPKEFLLKQIDAMAMLKLNRMHLHLTDGAGWRIQIDRYPRLTGYAAWRPYRSWQDWWKADRSYCESSTPGAYGGFYTKDDIREIISYAHTRGIEVIPEIEMPGHSEEVIAAYPELSCSGIPFKDSDFCPGKEETFTFLENVLSEVMELFPSEYVHIGGDEAGKGSWKTCARCQQRMQEEGLTDVDQLQSYLIHRIEEFVNSRGKKIIGWDEILQGGLAPNATVMSWRGTEGGIKALKSGHDVIMTPGAYCYLDYTQDAPFKEPVSIGGYTPLEKVYSYEPVEAGIDSADAGHLLGIQANLWSEYITEDSHAEYMYYPRAFAIAETGWSRPEDKDYSRFRKNALHMCEVLEGKGYDTFDLEHEYGERRESLEPAEHIARGCQVTYNIPYSRQYPAAGDGSLTDGVIGGWTYGDRKWQGFLSDMDVTVDLGKVQPVRFIGATFMHSAGAWVHVPQKVEFMVSSDGITFEPAGTSWCDIPDDAPQLLFRLYSTTCTKEARYIRIHAVKSRREGAWLFTDEIIVN